MNAMGGGFAGPEPIMPDPNMGGAPMGDPSMGADPNAMGGDPNMMGADPGMDAGMGTDQMAGDANPNKAKEDIQKNIGKGCSDFRNYQGEDKEELGKWIEGMLDSVDDESSDAGIGEESEMPPMNNQMPQMESVIFTKGQLDKINEEFGIDNMSKKDDNINTQQKSKKDISNNNSPFNNPNFSK